MDDAMLSPIPVKKILSILLTYQCNAQCENCGTLSSPNNKVRLTLEDVHLAINQAANLDYQLIVFTGGEATLYKKELISGIKKANECGLPVRLVTNAHWAKSMDPARKIVKRLLDAGLTEINFSTGDQHTRFVPLENVMNASLAAVEHGLPVTIMCEIFRDRSITKSFIENHHTFKEIIYSYPNGIINIIESPWMSIDTNPSYHYPDGLTKNRDNLPVVKGCDSVLSTTTLLANGNIAACCGIGMRKIPELQLGNIDKMTLMEADQSAESDFLKRWIKVEGPERILAWASKHDPDIKWENMYAHQCQACFRLYKDEKVRQIIRKYHQEKMADVLFSEWLLHHYTK
ncbi:radical SAM protein [Anaerobacillus alkalidiazotrophicus]|uniref:Radical SAM protein n=1 Tax=Anaerobacillus alkalidiazotrophicus TaxID=472963 RepID=A0A1S2MAN3_9BACI|nr:radical SAM protein [Anaerobacillus alkalidiazotrophicus]OIJ20897.1 radical SAM protein [Anaerobacillus alkalidiazotrophicus]